MCKVRVADILEFILEDLGGGLVQKLGKFQTLGISEVDDT